MTNEYKPWEAEGLTEIEYVRRRNLELSIELASLDWQENVQEFCLKHDLTVSTSPTLPNEKDFTRCRNHIFEEAIELEQALLEGNLANIAKEGIDLIYVTLNLFVVMGVDAKEVWKLVHENNMLKPVGTKGPDGKVLKPKGWKKPNVRAAIERQIRLGTPQAAQAELGSNTHDASSSPESEEP